ncbi:MAG: hypothetical protein ACREMH_10155 [Gemmatimonadales bacterium]
MMGRLAVLALIGALGVAPAAAQSATMQIQANAFMLGTPLAIQGSRGLDFGFALLGVPRTVLPTSPAAGKWVVTGEKNADVLISFNLPATLSHVTLPATALPLSFPAGSARWRRRTDDPAGATAFTPALGATGRLGPPVEPVMYIWLGGTVSPAPTQAGGLYTATVVALVAYTN